MKDINFYVVHGWMLNVLELKGNNLLVFAIIYGFSQDGESRFNGSLKYLREATGASKNTVMAALDYLAERELIIKETFVRSNVTFCDYRQNERVVQKLTTGGAKIDLTGAEIGHNNKTNNITDKKDISLFPDEPIQTFNFKQSLLYLSGDPQLVNDWLSVRQKKRAANTKTALDAFAKEVEKTGITINDALTICVQKSWAGFEKRYYDNLTDKPTNGSQQNNTTAKTTFHFDIHRAIDAAGIGDNQ